MTTKLFRLFSSRAHSIDRMSDRWTDIVFTSYLGKSFKSLNLSISAAFSPIEINLLVGAIYRKSIAVIKPKVHVYIRPLAFMWQCFIFLLRKHVNICFYNKFYHHTPYKILLAPKSNLASLKFLNYLFVSYRHAFLFEQSMYSSESISLFKTHRNKFQSFSNHV